MGAFLLCGVPSAASAATFGADLSNAPFSTTAAYSLVTVTGPTGAAGSPASGVLTSVRIKTRGNAGTGVVRILREMSRPDSNTYRFFNAAEIPVAVSADATSDGHITEVLTRHTINVQDRLGWYLAGDAAGNTKETYTDVAYECAYLSAGIHAIGGQQDYSTASCNSNILLVSGTVENDNDADGFGDESQDSDDDNDGAPDAFDAFPLNVAESSDTDGDGTGNNGDPDDDNDGTADSSDAFPLNPAETADADEDGIGDNADTDDDNDGLSDASEATAGSSRTDVDSDDDGLRDNTEVNSTKTSPAKFDTDGDKLSDGLERGVSTAIADPPGAVTATDPARFRRDTHTKSKTDPRRKDTDKDGLSDGKEDKDRDGRKDKKETDPRKKDTDKDGRNDKRDRSPLNKNRR